MDDGGEQLRKVLIVDDQPNILATLEFMFRHSGYDVRLAADGAAALDQADAWRPDVMLLDVSMPVKSGFEVCQAVRDRPDLAGTRIVMLSARGGEAEISKALSLGADRYVTKPFSTRELLATVEQLLGPGAAPRR